MEARIDWIAQPEEAPCRSSEAIYGCEAARLLEAGDGLAAIEAAARLHPEKPAVVDDAVMLSYADFLDRSYGLAWELIQRYPTGSIVASLVNNSAASPVIVLAGALAGIVLVPIDASHPRERQVAIFAHSGAVAILLSRGDVGVDTTYLPLELPRIIVDVAIRTGARRPVSRYDLHAPQMVSFTSGSTGRPKGMVASGAYGNTLLAQFVARFRLDASDFVLSLASLSSGGARDAFLALTTGATLRICDISRGFGEILKVMRESPITILSFVPSALRMLIETDGAGEVFGNLRVLDLHGERILASDIALFRRKLTRRCQISVTMGSIEAGAIFSWLVDDTKINGATVPVGYVLPGRRVALLEESGGSVARGDIGELVVRGLMSLGAWHEGRLTSGPFLADPDDAASRIYPMGDLMRERPDGLFEFVGRKGRRIKVHGLWVDLGEVETALRTMSGVADAVVMTIARKGERDRLAAFIVMSDGAPCPPRGTMAKIVADQTARHMVPSFYRSLAAIPRLANFKPDLLKLEAMLSSQTAT